MLQPPTDPRRLTETGDPSLRGDNNPSRKPQPPRMSPRVNDLMRATLAAAGQKDWTTAKAKLAEARTVPNPSDFDTFEIDNAAAFVSVNTGDYANALASYKKVIASPFFAMSQTSPQQSSALRTPSSLPMPLRTSRAQSHLVRNSLPSVPSTMPPPSCWRWRITATRTMRRRRVWLRSRSTRRLPPEQSPAQTRPRSWPRVRPICTERHERRRQAGSISYALR